MQNTNAFHIARPGRLGTGLLAAALMAAALGCSDDSVRVVDAPLQPDGAAGDPLYLVATILFTADDTETYLVTTDHLDSSASFDVTSGVKVLGEVVPIINNGSVFVTDEAAPSSIKRYDVGANGQLQKGAEVSFAGVGVTEITSWFVYMVNETKAYVFDPAGSRIVVWNPSTMTLTGKQIDLSALDRAGWTPRLALEEFSPRRRGANLLVPTAWTGQDDEYRYASGLLVLDTDRDELVSFTEDERCGESYMSVEGPGGDLYFFPSAFSSAPHFFADDHGPTCVLRVRAGETQFDPEYELDLSALGTGQAATSAVPDGNTGFYFGAADSQLFADREDNGGAYWRIWHYDFATGSSEAVPEMPVWPGSLYYNTVDGHSFLPYWSETDDGSRTVVFDTGTSGKPSELFSFEASWGGFGRLR